MMCFCFLNLDLSFEVSFDHYSTISALEQPSASSRNLFFLFDFLENTVLVLSKPIFRIWIKWGERAEEAPRRELSDTDCVCVCVCAPRTPAYAYRTCAAQAYYNEISSGESGMMTRSIATTHVIRQLLGVFALRCHTYIYSLLSMKLQTDHQLVVSTSLVNVHSQHRLVLLPSSTCPYSHQRLIIPAICGDHVTRISDF